MKNILVYWMIIFLLILFSGCSGLKTIELSGVAKDAKAGAVVVSKDQNNIYYIDNLKYWNDKFLNKSIIVTGKVDTVVYPVDTTSISQTIKFQYIIRNPKYKLIESKDSE